MSNKEIKSLTGIRGVAALYVAVYHFYFFCREKEYSKSFNNSIHNFLNHGYIGVDLFFVLSAFVITLSSKKLFEGKLDLSNWIHFMKRRWVRIYPTYAIVLIYSYIFIAHFNRTTNFLFSFSLLNALFNIPYLIGAMWSLSTEWLLYIVYPFYFKISFLKCNYLWILLLFTIGVFILLITSYLKHQVFSSWIFNLELMEGYPSLFRCLGDYFIGMAGYKLFEKRNKSVQSGYFSTIILCLCLLLLFIPNTDLYVVLLFALIIASIGSDKNIVFALFSSKIVYFLGIVSYPLYLIHIIVLSWLTSIRNTFFIAMPVISGTYPLFFIFLFLTVSISYLFTTYVEKPIVQFLVKKVLPTKLSLQ